MKGRILGLAATGAAFLLMSASNAAAAPGRPGMGTPQYIAQLKQNFNESYNQFYRNFGQANKQQRQQVYNQMCLSGQTNALVTNHLRSDKDTYMQLFNQQADMYTQMANRWDQQGRNTGQLRNDLDTLRQKIDQLGQDYDALINEWNNLATNGQQASPSQGQIQPLLNKVNNDLRDIRSFLGQNIQQDIYNVMGQNPYLTPTPTPNP